MHFKQPKYLRAGRFIRSTDPDAPLSERLKEFPSISKAKHWSRTWQQANGNLGDGQIRVQR